MKRGTNKNNEEKQFKNFKRMLNDDLVNGNEK